MEASENVFDAPLLLGVGRILAESKMLELQAGLGVLRQRLTWRDRGNLYRPTKTYVQLGHALEANPAEFVVGLASLAEWHSLWEAADTGSLEERPRYAGGLSVAVARTPLPGA